MGQPNSTNSLLRQVHVTYKDHKRLVTLPNDTYEALLDGFLETFKDVLPVSPEQARKVVWFQRYDKEYEDYVDIEPGSSIAGITKFNACLDTTRPPSSSYPLVSGKKYNLWALGSHAGNGYLCRKNATTVAADGNSNSVDCEWLATEVGAPNRIFWKFSSPDNKLVLVVENGQVTLKSPDSVQGTTDQFLPTINGRYQSFLPRADIGSNSNKQFLGAMGNGTVQMITNNNANPGSNVNPTPQTLFVPYFLS